MMDVKDRAIAFLKDELHELRHADPTVGPGPDDELGDFVQTIIDSISERGTGGYITQLSDARQIIETLRAQAKKWDGLYRDVQEQRDHATDRAEKAEAENLRRREACNDMRLNCEGYVEKIQTLEAKLEAHQIERAEKAEAENEELRATDMAMTNAVQRTEAELERAEARLREAKAIICHICVEPDEYLRRIEGGDNCHAGKDGGCDWSRCPQLRDGEPKATGRHCPLDRDDDRL